MAQEVVQVQTSQEEKYREERLKVTKTELLKLTEKVDGIYERLAFVTIAVGKKAEEGLWGIYEKLENVEKDVKDALVELNGMLYDLNVSPSSQSGEGEEKEVVVKSEWVNEIYNIFYDLADVYNDILFLLSYTLEAKFYEIHGKLEYHIRRALWSALLGLVDVLYEFTSC